MTDRLVIIGAGQAGFAMAAKLRALHDTRPITIIGAEDVLPYQRPPLSKKYLLGEMTFDRLLFRPEHWYPDNNVEIRLATWVEQIDRDKKQVALQDGSILDYGTLALTTGSAPRRLPAAVGGDLDGVYVARDKRDADLLADEMQPGRRVLIIRRRLYRSRSGSRCALSRPRSDRHRNGRPHSPARCRRGNGRYHPRDPREP